MTRVQSRNGTNSASDKDSLNAEFQQLSAEIGRVLGGTTFNGTTIIGASAGARDFQIGANTTGNDIITVTTSDMSADASITAVTTSTVVIDSTTTTTTLGDTINNIDGAINKINSERAMYGATQNRFESVIGNLQVSVENQSAAKSRIMDADFATETSNLSRAQILQQAGNAMVAQANSLPQQVLALLKG